MRDPKRIAYILKSLELAWQNNYDLRLGQLIENSLSRSKSKASLLLVEDDILLEGIETFIDKCPNCSKEVYHAGAFTWCSSYGSEIPWTGEYPSGCGYRLASG